MASQKSKAKPPEKTGLNHYLHRYVGLRGVRWSRYGKPAKLEEEFGELMEAIADHGEKPEPKELRHLKEETADLFFCLLGIAEANGFDLLEAVEGKTNKDQGRNGGNGR